MIINIKNIENKIKKMGPEIEQKIETETKIIKSKKNEKIDKQKLKKKEMVLITALENKQKDKMEEKRRIITEMIEKENKAKKNIEQFMIEQEKIRLQFENDINKKSKKYIFN